MAKVIIVGTSHISKDSIQEATETILRERPDCVALELDPERFAALLQKKREKASLRNPTYFVLNTLQTYLGGKTGVLPGSEMVAAIRAAREVRSQIALIDMDISEIMGRLGEISRWQKLKLFFKLLAGLVPLPGQKNFDLSKVPAEKMIDEALRYMKRGMPTIYRILITDRNEYMANWIRQLSKTHRKIVVVVGAGHKKGLEKLLKKRSNRPSASRSKK
ncbi:MAG: TraB/GumN family protein [Candidatus Aenigmatarchaeota archaeon]